MRGHYFKVEYVKHLPFVAGAMIDSHTTAEYWKNRTRERLGIKMPKTYVVHLGNSKELMEVAEDSVSRRVLREHVRESLGVQNEDLLFAIINSVSRGKDQDLFLRAFHESLQIIKKKKLQVPSMHAVMVGSDMDKQTKFETELRHFVIEKKLQDCVHFVNKTLTVAPYLASIDVLVQNSQARGECFGRITIEAMAFQLPVLVCSLLHNCFCWNPQALVETVTRDSIFRNPLFFVPKFLLRPSLSARKENDRDTPVFLSPMIKLVWVVEYLMLRPISLTFLVGLGCIYTSALTHILHLLQCGTNVKFLWRLPLSAQTALASRLRPVRAASCWAS
ncbi:hypothetical protein ACLB2K_009411 [Fragaria x ananassa]